MVKGPTVKWLIEHKKLSPYKYYSATLFNSEKLKKSSTGDYTNQSINDSAKSTLYGDIVKTWMDKAFGQRTIVYAHDTQHSKRIAAEFRKAGISAKHCDSKTPSDERKRIMRDFREGKITVLCNFGLVDEGYDVKECTCCVIARPTKSLVFNIQATMRCMRYLPNKIATIIDHAANYKQHGMPDTERQWSLKSRKNKRSNNVGVDEAITTCPDCFAVGRDKDFFEACDIHKDENGKPINGKVCFNCQSFIPNPIIEKSTKLKQNKNIELKDITNIRFVVTKDWRKAKSREELYEIAKQKGYKPGWAYYKAKQLNL